MPQVLLPLAPRGKADRGTEAQRGTGTPSGAHSRLGLSQDGFPRLLTHFTPQCAPSAGLLTGHIIRLEFPSELSPRKEESQTDLLIALVRKKKRYLHIRDI